MCWNHKKGKKKKKSKYKYKSESEYESYVTTTSIMNVHANIELYVKSAFVIINTKCILKF